MKKILTLVFVLSLTLSIGNAQDAKFKAMFIYNFTRQIDWPASYKSGDFVISVIGEPGLQKALKDFTKDKKAGGGKQDIVVKSATPDNISKCHVLYIPGSATSNLSSILNQVSDYSTLIITEDPNLTKKGAGISFVKKDDVLKYQYNEGNIRKYSLKVGSDLKQLGIAN